jgi:hypothetical protein
MPIPYLLLAAGGGAIIVLAFGIKRFFGGGSIPYALNFSNDLNKLDNATKFNEQSNPYLVLQPFVPVSVETLRAPARIISGAIPEGTFSSFSIYY